MNTNHPILNEELGDTQSESEDELDLFQLEVVSDKVVYVCNICDEVNLKRNWIYSNWKL